MEQYAPTPRRAALGAQLESVDAERRQRDAVPPRPVSWATAADVLLTPPKQQGRGGRERD